MYSTYSNDEFVAFESLYGYGVKMAKATQLANIVNKIKYSNVLNEKRDGSGEYCAKENIWHLKMVGQVWSCKMVFFF